MWYLGLYMASGVIAHVAMTIHTRRMYKGFDYESESDEAVDIINDSIHEYYGRWYIPAIILGLIVLLVAWPIELFITWHRYVKLINQVIADIEEDEEECPDED